MRNTIFLVGLLLLTPLLTPGVVEAQEDLLHHLRCGVNSVQEKPSSFVPHVAGEPAAPVETHDGLNIGKSCTIALDVADGVHIGFTIPAPVGGARLFGVDAGFDLPADLEAGVSVHSHRRDGFSPVGDIFAGGHINYSFLHIGFGLGVADDNRGSRLFSFAIRSHPTN